MMKLKVMKVGINGEGIAYFRKKPVFLPGAFPDEIVECKIKDMGRYYVGETDSIIRKSDRRIRPSCRHSSKCDACPFMELQYDEQLRCKKELLKEALHKYAGYDEEIPDIVASDRVLGYRNKCNMPLVEYKGRLECALYAKGSNIPVVIDRCAVHNERLEDIRKKILDSLNRHHCKAYDRKSRHGLRQLVLRGFDDEYQLCLITGNDKFSDDLVKDLSDIKGLASIHQCINAANKSRDLMEGKFIRLYGKEKIGLKLDGYTMQLSPQVFFQLNYSQALNIYRKVAERLEDSNGLAVEAYCGIGGISLYVSGKVKRIIGIELNKEAVKDARDNMKLNGITNAGFICGDAGKTIEEISRKEKITTLIVDPPRSGLDEKMIACINRSRISKIIYVSCNPATLAKNIAMLKDYCVGSIEGFDMFPNTPLVETVCCLYHQKKDFISVSYAPKNDDYLKQHKKQLIK